MLAIRVGQVFSGEQLLPDAGVVLVEGGRILGVQPPGMALPGGCAVADYSDATLLPGLIDTHVHLCGDSGLGALDRLPTFGDEELTAVIGDALRVHLAAGVTTVRDLGDRHWAVLDWRDRNQETTAAPTVLASGPPITSPRGHCWNMGGEAHGVRLAVTAHAHPLTAIRDALAAGVDAIEHCTFITATGIEVPNSVRRR